MWRNVDDVHACNILTCGEGYAYVFRCKDFLPGWVVCWIDALKLAFLIDFVHIFLESSYVAKLCKALILPSQWTSEVEKKNQFRLPTFVLHDHIRVYDYVFLRDLLSGKEPVPQLFNSPTATSPCWAGWTSLKPVLEQLSRAKWTPPDGSWKLDKNWADKNEENMKKINE